MKSLFLYMEGAIDERNDKGYISTDVGIILIICAHRDVGLKYAWCTRVDGCVVLNPISRFIDTFIVVVAGFHCCVVVV